MDEWEYIQRFSNIYIRTQTRKEILKRVKEITNTLHGIGLEKNEVDIIKKLLIKHFVEFYIYCMYKDEKIKEYYNK